uniref:sugar 3,4-ketoisomerase n=1 Tax=Algoriphagus sp. TaxID=1872435 RepID=UPI0040476745
MLLSVSDVQLVSLPHYFEENGDLVVMQEVVNIPFKIVRVFVVRAPFNAIRGEHAHRSCSQFLTCPTGTIEVICDDGHNKTTYFLSHPNVGLLLPPTIWAQQTYKTPGAVLTVLCDKPYDENDYIRDYEEFKIFRKINEI